MSDQVFEHGAGFQHGEVSGNVRLDKYEAFYEQIFAEALEDGVITAEERHRLERAAESMGLDKARLRQLEQALASAYTARHGVQIREAGPGPGFEASDEARASLQVLEPATDQRTLALERRIKALEARIAELEGELEDARASIAVEVDFSDLAGDRPAAADDDPGELVRRLRHDPRDEASLHGLYRAYAHHGDVDAQWRASAVLVHLGAATADEADTFRKHRAEGLIKPTGAIGADGWRRLLFHPDEELLTELYIPLAAPTEGSPPA